MGVLKKYIEMLPGRLFSENAYHQICSMELNEQAIPGVKKLFDAEESERKKLASDMFRFCHAITEHSSQNRMDIRAVSTAFPILIVPHAVQKDALQYMMAMQKVPVILSFFITHGKSIFEWQD